MTLRHPSRRRSVIALILLGVVVGAMAPSLLVRATTGARSRSPHRPRAARRPFPARPHPARAAARRRADGGGQRAHRSAPRWRGGADLPAQRPRRGPAPGSDSTLAATGIRPVSDAAPAVAAQTGIRVDGTLVLDRLAFAGLVDAIGASPWMSRPRWWRATGSATSPQSSRWGRAPWTAPRRRCTHSRSTGRARVGAPGAVQPSLERGPAKLPGEPEKVRAILGNLGALARSDQATAVQADLLARAARASRAHTMAMADLAVLPGAEGPDPQSWIDPAAAEVQARTLFASELLPPEQPPVRVRLCRRRHDRSGAGAARPAEPGRLQRRVAGRSTVSAASRPAASPSTIAAAGSSSPTSVGSSRSPWGNPRRRGGGPCSLPGAPLTLVYSVPVATRRPRRPGSPPRHQPARV